MGDVIEYRIVKTLVHVAHLALMGVKLDSLSLLTAPLMARAQLRSAVVLMPGEGKLYCVLQWYWPLIASTELLYVHLHSCQDLMSGSLGHKALVLS